MSDLTKPVLAFDSVLGGCVAAVLLPDGRSFARELMTDREQAAKLMPMVQDVMKEAGVEFSDLGLIVTSTGPGSFTGLRISLSAARAMGLALDIPVQGISTLEAMFASCDTDGEALVVLESKRTDFYVQAFDGQGKAAGEPACLLSGDIKAKTICGDAADRLKEEGVLADFIERRLPDPTVMAHLGWNKFVQNGFVSIKPEPFYMREADVSISTKSQREINISNL